MSKKFYAINRETGEKWKPSGNYEKQFLVMYDSGYLAEVIFDGYYYTIEALNPKAWKTINNFKTLETDL